MVCALGREDGTIIEQVSIPTTTPEETIPKITAYFKDKGIEALGIGAFGPVGVDPKADMAALRDWTVLFISPLEPALVLVYG